MIEACNVSVLLGGKGIVGGVDFSAQAGQFTAIVGPNGSGKTTFLRALTGDLAYRGHISIGGREVSAMRPAQAAGQRAVLQQATVLAFPFTVREVVRLGMMSGRSGVFGVEADRLPDRALERVDLAGFGGRFYQELSGGEQQRVQLARVLCQVWVPVVDGAARVLFLDEPVSSLDIKHQLVIMDIARDFARRGGATVAILHDLNLTAMFADVMHVMHSGSLVASGPPSGVLSDAMIETVFDCALKVRALPAGDAPFVLPQSLVEQSHARA